MLKKTNKIKKIIIILLLIFLSIAAILGGLSLYGKSQTAKIPELSFMDALEYTTRNNKDAIITVGVIKGEELSWTVYGENGQELPREKHIYEIGSLTKTFTSALINKAIADNKIDLDATVDDYLSLPAKNSYPTIEELLTHTSGYKSYYFESPMVENFFKGRNAYCGITKDMVLDKVGSLDMKQESHDFSYSNFGYAVLGLVLEEVYDTDYTTLVNDFAQDELGLRATQISDQNGDLGNYWSWNSDDAYLAAGAIASNIEDMLRYEQIQMEDKSYFKGCHTALKTIDASTDSYKTMGIYMDEIGMAWVIDNKNGIIWHNGGTADYNCYLGFNAKSGDAVVILSNLSPSYRIPATVLGVKLLSEITD